MGAVKADGRPGGARGVSSGIPRPDPHKRTIRLLQTLNQQDMPNREWHLGDDSVLRPAAQSHLENPLDPRSNQTYQ
ncbi:MAG: hypothetical protein Q6K95_09715 [Gloeomargarita sp. GXS_bins_116]